MLRSIVKYSSQLDFFARSFTATSRAFSNKKNDSGKPDSINKIQKSGGSIKTNDDDSGLSRIEFSKHIPHHADVVVIGGGAMGSSTAYWLKKKLHRDLKVLVIEQDPTYCQASTTLSVGGLRQQFSLEENIRMSLFGAEFLRNLDEYLGIENEPPIDVNFRPHGYLLLASEEGAETLANNSRLQNSMGAKNILLTPNKLKSMFPWISTDGIALGCLGLEKEGWFDPWTLLCAFKKKAIHLGVDYLHAEATDFSFEIHTTESGKQKMNLTRVQVQTPDGQIGSVEFAVAVIAAGPFSGKIAEKANIGVGEGIMSVPLPVEPRKRFVYCFDCPDGPGLNTPLTIDPTGTYFRREGLAGSYIAGRSPEPHEEPSIDNLNVNHEYFEEQIWPVLANRVKAFEKLKVMSSWAGYYEYNTFDANGIIGKHPEHDNLIFATGFSGHGIQHSPAVGRAVAELILDYQYITIDLSRLGFERFIDNEPMHEVNIV